MRTAGRAFRHVRVLAWPIVACLAAGALPAAQPGVPVESASRESVRPRLFVTAEPRPGLRSLADVRRGIHTGHARDLWVALLAKVNRERWEPPLAPVTRTAGGVVSRNRDFAFVATAAARILDAALVALILDDRGHAEAALRQIEALFDPGQWPEWADQNHVAAGLNADLRHGQLVMPVALAYDWLHRLLTPEERKRVVDGLERCAIRPFKAGVAAKEQWSRRRSNWMTTVVGGFGIAGMALDRDHPDSTWLVDFARERMETYLAVLGPEGEFNESVQYAGSMAHVVRYFTAVRYASEARDNPFDRHPLAKFYRWYTHMTFPPGRVAGFGDPAPDMPPVVGPAAAVAAMTRDPLLQWLYLSYCDRMQETHRQRALELLYFDADLAPESPAGRLPLGRAYHHEARLISSRSSWDPAMATSVVAAKAGRESIHSHADWGQVCIDGYGEPLVVDLKASYPARDKERYYEYQQWGHNVLVLGRNGTGGVPLTEHRRQGTITRADFDDVRGGAWTMDLTAVYDGVRRVTRRVVHLLPRVVVVLDEAHLEAPQPVSLRWHLAGAVPPAADGSFRLSQGRATLAGRVVRLDGPADVRAGSHRYAPPYDRGRSGEPIPPRNEPYVEIAFTGGTARLLSLFCILDRDDVGIQWRTTAAGWTISTLEGEVDVALRGDVLTVRARGTGSGWELPLAPPPVR